MVLAAFGTEIPEHVLAAEARLEERGTHIDELERLARHFGLGAQILETTVEDLGHLLTEGKLPIAYLDRAVFDLTPRQRLRHSLRAAKIHTVIPVRVTKATIVFHDPLRPRVTRKSLRLFTEAHRRLGNYCVVCSSL
jgi:hypothetical protein